MLPSPKIPFLHAAHRLPGGGSSSAPASRSRVRVLLLAVLLSAGLAGGMRAQTDPAGDPTGNGGDFNGLVTTAGSYDAYTANAKRVVTDLVVPGSNGVYPLAFTRYANSRATSVAGDYNPFAEGGNWRHSYQWLATQNGSVYTVAYPDGRAVNFSYGRGDAPQGETYYRGPVGTSERLEVDPNGNYLYLHMADGGIVNFALANSATNNGVPMNTYQPFSIADRYGAITTLRYGPVVNSAAALLLQVTEPGGRSLTLGYVTLHATNSKGIDIPWVVLSTVTSSNGQYVSYQYQPSAIVFNTTYYQALAGVVYNNETDSAGKPLAAAYNYYAGGGGPPLLLTCDDPHYAGPMVRILYNLNAGNSGVWGAVWAEANYPRPNSGDPIYNVSVLGQNVIGQPTYATDTRGDTNTSGQVIARSFYYGQSTTGPGNAATNAKSYQTTTVTDFEGNASSIYYNPIGSPNGRGYVCQTIDPAGALTQYVTEPFAGKVTRVILPDSRKRRMVWGSMDGATTTNGPAPCLNPFFLYQTIDEHDQPTYYYRYPNTGYLNQIAHPDGSTDTYRYAMFAGVTCTYFKVNLHTTRLGAAINYTFGGNHGGSGRPDLLTTISRTYTDAAGAGHTDTTQLYYDGLDRVNEVVDPDGVTDYFAYNGRHQLTQVLHAADGTHVDYTYDNYGRQTTVSDELTHVTTTQYDDYGRPTSVTWPVDAYGIGTATTQFTYDRRNNSNQVVGAALSHTSGQFSYKILPSGRAEQRIYSPNNWLTDDYLGQSAGGAGNPSFQTCQHEVSVLQRDQVGRVLASADAEGQTWSSTYDLCGRRASSTDPLGHATVWTYYAAGQPDNNGLNCGGWLQSVQSPGPDAANCPTVTTSYLTYDVNGYPTQVQTPAHTGNGTHIFTSAHDAAGDLISQSDGLHATPYGYDQLGRLGLINYADGSTETWSYDAAGHPSAYKNRAGHVANTLYDGRGRPGFKSWRNGGASATSWFYDAASRVTLVANDFSQVGFTYDDSGGLASENATVLDQPTRTTTYTHDLDGNVDSITYPNGNYPCFTYDALGRCHKMTSGGVTYGRYDYAGDRLTDRVLLNGLYTAYGYQNNGRVTDVWHINGNTNTSVSRHAYGYAPDGRISWFDREADGGQSGSALENGRGDVFDYYADGSLHNGARDVTVAGGWPGIFSPTADSGVPNGNVSYPGGSANTYGFLYNYDAAGNRAQPVWQMNQPAISYAADGENRYYGSGYDANSNTSDSAVGWQYAYDDEGHLVTAQSPATGQAMTCYYDGLGRLVYRGTNSSQSVFYYSGAQRIEERDYASGAVNYLYFFDAPGSGRILFRQGGPWWRLWYQYDLMGNTTHLSAEAYNAQGQLTGGYVVEQYLYDAYGTPSVYDAAGNLRPAGSVYDNRYLWHGSSGYEWQPASGLYLCGARFYLPQHGRFLQPDPIGQAGGLNLYSYCGNDPVNGVDPSGLDSGPTILQRYDEDGSSDSSNAGYSDGSAGGYEGNRLVLDPDATQITLEDLQHGQLDLGAGVLSSLGIQGVPRDPLADPHGVRNVLGGVIAGTSKALFNAARSVSSAAANGLPFASTLNDALLAQAEGAVNGAGSSLAASVGIDPNSDSFQRGLPGGQWLAGAGLLLTGVGEADVAEGSGVLFRFGSEAPTLETLSSKAAEAAKAGFPHGVSSSSKLPPKFANNFRSALRSDVEQHFEVRQTSKNPFHHTVVLPNPVTQDTVDLFNSLFR